MKYVVRISLFYSHLNDLEECSRCFINIYVHRGSNACHVAMGKLKKILQLVIKDLLLSLQSYIGSSTVCEAGKKISFSSFVFLSILVVFLPVTTFRPLISFNKVR